MREWVLTRLDVGAGSMWYAHSLDRARELVRLAGGCWCLGREDEDEPQIVETWI